MVTKTELFESQDLTRQIFVCELRCIAKFAKESWVNQTNCLLVFWKLLPAYINVVINSGEQHAFFAHELQSALRLAVGFANIYCEL